MSNRRAASTRRFDWTLEAARQKYQAKMAAEPWATNAAGRAR